MSGFKVEFSVLNLRATPGIYADALASRPAAGYPGRVFIDTDNPSTGIYRDTGTVWVQIAETATSDVDTLQNVTDNGNTTTNSISVGHASTPVAIIDARTPFTNLNNADSFCVAANTARNITSNASFGVNYVNTVYGFQSLVFNGNATIGNGGINSAGNFINFLNNNTTGTVSVTQAATIRAIAGTQTGIYYNTGAASTVFTHVAALKTLQPINTGSLPALVTNNYGLLVADNTANSGTITYTNRWGIYQEGASDKNYFAANVLIKSTTDNGNALQVTGNGYISANLGIGTTSPGSKLSINDDGTGMGFTNAASGNFNIGLLAGTGSQSAYVYQRANADLIIGTNNTERMRITSGGIVGIGTTSPTYKVDIAQPLGIYWNGTSFNGTPVALSISNTQAGGYDAVLILQQTDGGGTTKNAGAIGMVGTGSWTAGNNASQISDMYFLVRNSSGGISERMRITSGGNVGIGTTTPASLLEVYKASSDNYIYTTNGTTDTFNGLMVRYNGNNFMGAIGNILTGEFRIGGFVNAGYFLTAYTNNSERMRITGAGELLINTTTDVGDFKLQVSGNAYVSGTIGINATSPDAASLLQIDSTTKGFLLPRMTDAQITAISNPPDGLMVYSTDQNHIAYYDAVAARWKKVSNSNL